MSDTQKMVVPGHDENSIDITDYESLGMTPSDTKSFFKWALGTSPDPPEVVQKMMVNLSSKLSVGLGINIVGNIGRQTRLTQFLEEMEKELYDIQKIPELGEKEKMSLYKEARSTLNALIESQRKFIAQSKEIKSESSEQEKLLGRIMSLPKDKLSKIISILDDDSKPDSKVSEDIDDIFPEELSEEV